MLKEKSILLGVTGGIACYKAAELARLFVKAGARVDVVMTKAAAEFITPLTMQTLSGNPVHQDLFNLVAESEIGHISLAQRADILVVAPATANCIGKVAGGIADDLLTTVISATGAPVLFCPAMNDRMWSNPIVRENVEKLRRHGYHFVDPGEGELACGTEGVGRLADLEKIISAVVSILSPKPLAGKKILVSAGPTQEYLDPVRYLSNRSSGKMGYALAEAARDLGAQVTLVSGPTALPDPCGVKTIRVRTAEEMLGALKHAFKGCGALLMCAAVADFRPAAPKAKKTAKKDMPRRIELAQNPDIVAALAAKKGRRTIVGFAAQTEKNAHAVAMEKLSAKNLDFVVLNDVSDPKIGFESDENEVLVIGKDGAKIEIPRDSKSAVARRILEIVFHLD